MDELIVEPTAVADAEDAVPVDVRDPWEYDGIGHLPGAVNIPFERFRSDGTGPTGMLPAPAHWASLLGEAGLGPADRIVAYDDTHGVFAARFVVTALLYGHTEVHLLNGDYSAWIREHAASTEAVTPDQVTYPTPALDRSVLVDADAVARAAVDEGAVLVDTRSPEEFAEGHIEGATNLDWVELVDEDTRRLRPEPELRRILGDRGIVADRRIVLYCNTARRISHTYVVLRHLGFETVDFYEGSLTEWRDAGRPLVSE
ncbi:MAG: sulfurtransferase [Halobacteriaceae archaeon]